MYVKSFVQAHTTATAAAADAVSCASSTTPTKHTPLNPLWLLEWIAV